MDKKQFLDEVGDVSPLVEGSRMASYTGLNDFIREVLGTKPKTPVDKPE